MSPIKTLVGRRGHTAALAGWAAIMISVGLLGGWVIGGTISDTSQRTVELERLERDNSQSKVALCALRADLERRAAGGIKFLAEHPHGIPGISGKTIRDGIVNQQRTISALRVLSCPSK